jgi:hypothetical protein
MLPLSVKLRALQLAEDEETLATGDVPSLRRFAGVLGDGRDDVVGAGVLSRFKSRRVSLKPRSR